MKKLLPIFIAVMISVLSFSIYHAVADVFPGNITGSTADVSGKGSLTVNGVPLGSTVRIYDSTTNNLTHTASNAQTSFTIPGINAGKYYATVLVGEVQSDRSNIAEIKPAAVQIWKDEDTSNAIRVRNAIPTAQVILYNESIAGFEIVRTADRNGNVIFENLPTGRNYRVKQIINNAESPPSAEGIDIRPRQVNVFKESDAGPNNDQGSIRVIDGTIGHTLEIYSVLDRVNFIDSVTLETTTTHIFNGLPAGRYVVVQKKDGLVSLDSIEMTIGDQQAPVITLNGAKQMRVTYPNPYVEPGATAIDNDGTDIIVQNNANEVLPFPLEPGRYTITYTARDTAGNTSTDTREVTVVPNVVELTPVHTQPDVPDDQYGEINVTGVIPGATLYLYQDNSGGSNNLITYTPEINRATYEFLNVPVGEQYYVIQEVNGIRSEPSLRTNILDRTPPQLLLIGNEQIVLTAGEPYNEQGASATDNVDEQDSLTVQIGGDQVNIEQPGVYTITYNSRDKAGNSAAQITRTVIIKPRAVTIVGSTADIGEIGVTNIMPSSVRIPVRLELYKYDSRNETWSETPVKTATLTSGETSYLFKGDPRLDPGQYYVKQVIAGQVSVESNIVDIIDNDRPYIELTGSTKYAFVWGSEYAVGDGSSAEKQVFYTVNNVFKDPFATARDYIDGDLKEDIRRTVSPDGYTQVCVQGNCDIQFQRPGKYTLTYNVAASRGTAADPKTKTITIAPAKTGDPVVSGEMKNTITVSGIFDDTFNGPGGSKDTTVTLYNSYGQKMASQVVSGSTAIFEKVPAGRGYYVTQTFAGIESAKSASVSVSSVNDDDLVKFISIGSFSFKSPSAVGTIDQSAGTIAVTVPAGTSVTSLSPTFTTEGSSSTRTVRVGSVTQVSGQTAQNFTNPVIYTVTDGARTKSYVVTVKVASNGSSIWRDSVQKEVAVTTSSTSVTLTSTEKRAAEEKGVSFATGDGAIHVPASNVKEAAAPTLVVRKMPAYLFLNWRDPDWVDDLSDMTEISWGGKDAKLMQPIELETTGKQNQTFVRLVRANDKLYAIAQPSEIVNGKMIGFVQQSGIYAVLDRSIPQPAIMEGNPYRIYSSLPGAEIYYTTNSKDIGFNRSARNNAFASYTFDGTPGDLSSWTKYTTGFAAPNGKVFAFAMSDQIITPIDSVVAYKAVDWQEQVPTVATYKTWSITFNMPLERKVLYSGAVYVTDAAGNRVDTALNLSSDGKTLSVSPKQGYTRNQQYTLWVQNELKNNTADGEFLKESIKLTFTVN